MGNVLVYSEKIELALELASLANEYTSKFGGSTNCIILGFNVKDDAKL